MRLTAVACIALSFCGPAPASRPVVVFAPPLPASGPVVLDEQGVRELLAGVELELGDERARTSRAEALVKALTLRLRETEDIVRSESWRATWGPVIAGAVSGFLAFAAGFLGCFLVMK